MFKESGISQRIDPKLMSAINVYVKELLKVLNTNEMKC